MKKAVFIIPHFGKFPSFFQLFLNSCAKNPDYDWYIFTDDKTNYHYPNNVFVEYFDFKEFTTKIKNKFEIDVCLESPYKLCDYRPLYGYIFSEYTKNYPYWGYCDCDLIFGQINNFINFHELKEYDKIGVWGHMAMLKSSQNIWELIKTNFYDEFKNIFSINKPRYFDENFHPNSINYLFEKLGLKIYHIPNIADIRVAYSDFKLAHYDRKISKFITKDQWRQHFFLWNNGLLFRFILNNRGG